MTANIRAINMQKLNTLFMLCKKVNSSHFKILSCTPATCLLFFVEFYVVYFVPSWFKFHSFVSWILFFSFCFCDVFL